MGFDLSIGFVGFDGDAVVFVVAVVFCGDEVVCGFFGASSYVPDSQL